jgi:hypothetical protein
MNVDLDTLTGWTVLIPKLTALVGAVTGLIAVTTASIVRMFRIARGRPPRVHSRVQRPKSKMPQKSDGPSTPANSPDTNGFDDADSLVKMFEQERT